MRYPSATSVLLFVLIPLALIVLLLHVREVSRTGLAQPPIYAAFGAGQAAYPIVGGSTVEVSGEHPLEVGDRLIRIGETDLQGQGYLGFMGAAFAAAGESRVAPLVYERGGERRETMLQLAPFSVPWLRIPFLATMLTLVTVLLLRRPNDPFIHQSAATFSAVVFGEAIFEGGGPHQVLIAKMIFISAGAFWWPMVLYFVAGMPNGFRKPSVQRWLPLLALVIAALWSVPKLLYVFATEGDAIRSDVIPSIVSGADALTIAIPAVLFAMNYRGFDAHERVQMKWVVYCSWAAGLVMFAALVMPVILPGFAGFDEMLAVAGITATIIPIGVTVSILEFRLFELDRLIGRAVSVSILFALFLGVLFVLIPPLSQAFARVFSIAPESGRIVLSMLLAGGAIPGYLWLAPRLTSYFFPEQERLESGLHRLIEEQAVQGDARSVARHMASTLYSLVRPTFCAAYSFDHALGEYVLIEESAEPHSAFPAPSRIQAGDPLLNRLRAERGILVMPSDPRLLGQVSEVERGFTDRVQTALIIPHLDEEADRSDDLSSRAASSPRPISSERNALPGTIVVAGPKQSGGDFSAGELSLLTAALLSTTRHLKILRQAEDLNEERDRSEALESANLARSHYLASASHDLRQPLHALQLFSEALHERTHDDETRSLSDRIRSSASALQEMFDALIDLSRIDQNQIVPNRSSFQIRSLVNRLASESAPVAESRGLDLSVSMPDVRVESDPVLLGRLIQNLLTNALRYTEEGRIEIRGVAEEERLRIDVQDSGVGIPLDQQEQIFEEFVRLETATESRGLGLGLSIVQRLSNLLEHPVSLSSGVGRGSTFSVDIPMADEAESSIGSSALSSFAGKTMLVVDDDLDILAGMQALLESWGCTIRLASNGAEAIEALLASPSGIDLMLVDFRLTPPEDGLDVVAELRQRASAEIPAILVSGTRSNELDQRAAESGLTLLPKPIPPARLRAAIAQALR
ncbi:MAG: hybrid sensor histidine kinase/response regulator [Myxococcota bacterium]